MARKYEEFIGTDVEPKFPPAVGEILKSIEPALEGQYAKFLHKLDAMRNASGECNVDVFLRSRREAWDIESGILGTIVESFRSDDITDFERDIVMDNLILNYEDVSILSEDALSACDVSPVGLKEKVADKHTTLLFGMGLTKEDVLYPGRLEGPPRVAHWYKFLVPELDDEGEVINDEFWFLRR